LFSVEKFNRKRQDDRFSISAPNILLPFSLITGAKVKGSEKETDWPTHIL